MVLLLDRNEFGLNVMASFGNFLVDVREVVLRLPKRTVSPRGIEAEANIT